MKYRVIKEVKSRKTPSMYEVVTKSVPLNTEFFSDMKQTFSERIPVGGAVVAIVWVLMPDKYWIPMVYKGEVFLSETIEVPTIPPETIIKRILEIDTITGKIRIDGGEWQ
jgi:hypothetical protein